MPRALPAGAIRQGRHDYTEASSLDFWDWRWQFAYLGPMPERCREETLARARRLARERPNSYLGRNLRRLYGVTP